jgi:cytochrome c oxidase subunit II
MIGLEGLWGAAVWALTLLERFAGSLGAPLNMAEPSFWMPVRASTTAGKVDWLFYFILGISIVFFLLIVTLMFFFVLRYRRRKGQAPPESASHNTKLELTWSIIPFLLILLIFYFGFRSFLDIATPPENSYEVLVTAQKWSWQFAYPNGHVDQDLHVPVDTPVQLVMTSEDVIHSLYVPAFRIKKDLVPGRYTKTWFEATVVGDFTLYCAEYCGLQHSDMLARVVVHEPGGFEKWLEDAGNYVDKLPPAEAGARLIKARGCLSCHSVDGSAGIGPTLKGIYNHEAILSDGSRVKVDEDYIRQSILDPMAQIVAGYDPVMPTYQGRIKDKEITVIIEYIKTLE